MPTDDGSHQSVTAGMSQPNDSGSDVREASLFLAMFIFYWIISALEHGWDPGRLKTSVSHVLGNIRNRTLRVERR